MIPCVFTCYSKQFLSPFYKFYYHSTIGPQYILYLYIFIYREGSVQVGDRIIAINEYNVAHFTLSEASMFLQQCGHEANFTVEYDVSVMGMYIIRYSGTCAIRHMSFPTSCDIRQKFMVARYF